jgi:phosphonate utilization associated putative membrane protein
MSGLDGVAPTIPAPVVAAVLVAALLHAAWNALIKSSGDKELDTALIHTLGCAIGVPMLLLTGLPAPASWPWLAASLVIHVGYYIALAGAYRHGDLGFAYPLMRGTAPLLVALGSATLIGETLPAVAWIGIAGISAGVLMVGFSHVPRDGGSHGHALAFALANAVIIAAYTVVDGHGVRASGNALAYVALLFCIDGIPYATLVMHRRGPERRPAAWAYVRKRWPVAAVGSVASLGAYGIALWAMTKAPVAAVAALRETSVLFAAVIGARWLGEGFGAGRIAGAAAIVAGVVALRLA